MKTKKLIYFLGFSLPLSLLIASEGWTQGQPETKAPNVTYASW